MTNQENLAAFENTERFLAFKLLNTFDTVQQIDFTSGKICYDVEINLKNNKKALGECKVRNFQADKYPDYILEVMKLTSLIKKAQKTNSEFIYYINFFINEDNTKRDFIIFNLSERCKVWKTEKPQIKKMWMNHCTYISNVKVEKEIILLQYDPKIDKRGTFSLN